MLRRLAHAGALLLPLMWGVPAGAAAEAGPRTVRATAADLFNLADAFAKRGAPERADAILSLLSQNPNGDVRNEARFRRSKLLKASGHASQAAVLLRQIVDEKPDATPVRLELAALLDQLGDKEGAWRQIRAAQAAGLPPAVARIVDRYSEALRAQRPFGASIEFALAPDSNINRATRSDTLGTVLGDFDIDKDSKAKSGTGISLHGQIYRRIGLSSDASLLVRLTSLADLYREKQFNDIAADVAVGPELTLGRDRLQVEVGATQRWFGQKQFMRSARVGATFSHPLGIRTLLRLSGSAALADNQINDLQDGKLFSGQVGIERALSPTTGIAANLSFDRQSLKDPGYSTTGWRTELTGWRDFGRLTLTAGAELGRLSADDRLSLFPHKRADRYTRFSLGATFRQLQFRGFAPIARFSIERNRSSVEFYDYSRRRTEVGFVRAF